MTKQKTHTSAEVKNRWNKKNYTQHRFNTVKGSELERAIKVFKKNNPQAFNKLVCRLLEKHFKKL